MFFFLFLAIAAVGPSRQGHSFMASLSLGAAKQARIKAAADGKNCKSVDGSKNTRCLARDDAYMANETRSTGRGPRRHNCAR